MTSKMTVEKVTRKKNVGNRLTQDENCNEKNKLRGSWRDENCLNKSRGLRRDEQNKRSQLTLDENCNKTSDHDEVSRAHYKDNSATLSSNNVGASASIRTQTSNGFSAYGGGIVKPWVLGQAEIKLLHNDFSRALRTLFQFNEPEKSPIAIFIVAHGMNVINFVEDAPKLISKMNRLWFIRPERGPTDKLYKWKMKRPDDDCLKMIHSFFSAHNWCKSNAWKSATKMHEDYLHFHIGLAIQNRLNILNEESKQTQAIRKAENELSELCNQEEHIEDIKLIPSSVLINTPSPRRTLEPDDAPRKPPQEPMSQSRSNKEKNSDVMSSNEPVQYLTPHREQFVSIPLKVIQHLPVQIRSAYDTSVRIGKTTPCPRQHTTPSSRNSSDSPGYVSSMIQEPYNLVMYKRRRIEGRNSKHLSKSCGSWRQTKNKKQIPPINIKQIDMPPLDVIQVPAVSLGSDSQTTENGKSEHLSNSRGLRRQIKYKKVNRKEKKNIGTGGGPPSDHDSDPSDADKSSSPTKNSKRSKKKKAKKKKNKSSVDPNKNSSNEFSTNDDDPLGYKQTPKQIKFKPDKFTKLTPS